MSKTNTATPSYQLARATVRTVSVQIYSLLAWLLILVGGMVAVGHFFVNVSTADHISGISVGLITVAFGLGMARLLNRDIRQTAPVLWF